MKRNYLIRIMPLIMAFLVLMPACRSKRIPAKPHVSLSRKAYIETYSSLAIREMERTGIPASITMAQALLESGDGNSTLARNTNNHFGIKCHNDWKGKTYKHDDDRRKECFRVYGSVYDSYRDHSGFLMGKSRYASLFELDISDYKAWSKGLKKAGYATNPHYANLLIKIIEENELYKLDEGIEPELTGKVSDPEPKEEDSQAAGVAVNFSEEFAISSGKRVINEINRIEYIVTRKGDNFQDLSEEFGKMRWELPKYNDLPEDKTLSAGWIIFLQPKRNQASQGRNFHLVREGDDLWIISQKYGIKLEKLMQMNNMSTDGELKPEQKIILRK